MNGYRVEMIGIIQQATGNVPVDFAFRSLDDDRFVRCPVLHPMDERGCYFAGTTRGRAAGRRVFRVTKNTTGKATGNTCRTIPGRVTARKPNSLGLHSCRLNKKMELEA